MKYTLHDNGSWDISGGKIRLSNVYPSIDGVPLSPLRVHAGKDSIVYELERGSLELCFRQEADEVAVACRLRGLEGIHDVEPVGSAVIGGAENAFVQGFGMEGPSGTRRLSGGRLESNGLLALYGDDAALFVYAKDHRHYINRYCVCKKETLFGEGAECVWGGFNLEGTIRGDLELPSLFFYEGEELYQGLERCAGEIAACMGARTEKPPAFYWCSWYYLYQNLTQGLLEEYLAGFKNIPFQYVQVDAGYARSQGDWLLPNHHFPQGLKKAAETIIRAGYKPGIWIGPFIVGDQSELYKKHPDWVLHDPDGNPVVQLRSYNEPKIWGNPDCDYYVLDTSHPEAMQYLKEVFAALKSWGFSLFKTDFMLWNMHDSSKVKRYNANLTSVEIYRNTLQMIREAIGEESYLLGCIAPFLPSIGYVDGMRIAGDVGAQWAGEYGPVNMIRELSADSYFNNIYWQNDPDSVLPRDFNIFLGEEEIRSLALLQALSGGIVTTSDPLHLIAEERNRLLRFIMPGAKKVCPEFPYFGKGKDELVITHRLKQGNLLYALNPTEKPLTVVFRFGELFGESCWHVRKYGGKALGSDSFYAETLAPHACVLLFLTKEPLEYEPGNLWVWEN